MKKDAKFNVNLIKFAENTRLGMESKLWYYQCGLITNPKFNKGN